MFLPRTQLDLDRIQQVVFRAQQLYVYMNINHVSCSEHTFMTSRLPSRRVNITSSNVVRTFWSSSSLAAGRANRLRLDYHITAHDWDVLPHTAIRIDSPLCNMRRGCEVWTVLVHDRVTLLTVRIVCEWLRGDSPNSHWSDHLATTRRRSDVKPSEVNATCKYSVSDFLCHRLPISGGQHDVEHLTTL